MKTTLENADQFFRVNLGKQLIRKLELKLSSQPTQMWCHIAVESKCAAAQLYRNVNSNQSNTKMLNYS